VDGLYSAEEDRPRRARTHLPLSSGQTVSLSLKGDIYIVEVLILRTLILYMMSRVPRATTRPSRNDELLRHHQMGLGPGDGHQTCAVLV